MGCACCKTKQQLRSNTTITALLQDNVTNITDQLNPLLHVNETSDETKHDWIETPKLIPDIRQLQTIIFQSIHKNEYDFYPKYSGFSSIWNAQSIEEEKFNISHNLLNISLTIALYTNGANNAYLKNMYNLLNYSIRTNHNMVLLPDLVQLIITFISGITFCENIKHQKHREQLEFTYNNSIVTFKDTKNDYLNIRSNQPLVGDKIIINCHITSKGDEMWVGLVNNKTYGITTQIEKKFGSLLYYGGRERSIMNKLTYSKWDNGTGAIHGFANILETVHYYRSSDWISFVVSMKEKTHNCKIYKNGKVVFDIDKLPFASKSVMGNNRNCDANNEQDQNMIYFCVVVDDTMDSFIVEEVIYTENV